MAKRTWIFGILLFVICGSHTVCLGQTQAQLACEKAATAGYEYCLQHGIPCDPAQPSCGPHKGSVAQCLPAYSAAYARCQPSLNWTQMSGPSANVSWPPGRELAAYWTDAQGNFWLFGGYGLVTPAGMPGWATAINDLWKYTPTGSTRTQGSWKLMGGSNQPGVVNTSSMPGDRAGAAFAVDASGNVWLFGGLGVGPQTWGALNDLWEYTPGSGGAVGTWNMVWSSGPNVVNQPGNYGTQNTASSTNAPGGRWNSVCWMDSNGNFWLFGGFAIGSLGGPAYFFNDLWMYTPSAHTWTWVNGATAVSRNGTVISAGMPGGRAGASYWSDGKGTAWVFGGYGFDSTGALGALNDLWQFSSGTGQWSMLNGSATVAGANGDYGRQGIPATNNVPPGRSQAAGWKDSQGNLWLFGGANVDTWYPDTPPPILQNLFDDLWEYKPSSGTWIWVGGSQGLGSTAAPGARFGAAAWPEFFPNSWLFGGYGVDSPGQFPSYLYNLWDGTGTVY